MTHTEELNLRFDGAIPAALRSEAEARDRAEAIAAAGHARLRVKTWKPEGLAQRMADVMARRARAGSVTEIRHLVDAGFTRAEIETHAADARDKANLALRSDGI
jgi:hypothetical protein